LTTDPATYLFIEGETKLPEPIAHYVEQATFVISDDLLFLKNQDFFLRYSNQTLSLQLNTQKQALLFSIDFIGGKSNHRRLYGGGKKQPLAKACGLDKHPSWQVFDATGGVGKDAFVLASLGAKLTLCEKNLIIYNLLIDALARANQDNEISEIADRITAINGDSVEVLANLIDEQKPDVIYLDPMYPHRKKSAMIKKDMQVLQVLAGHETINNVQLFEQAIKTVRKRVVVKRPKTADTLTNHSPSYCVESVNTRYDVYVK